jgi:excisionase family DNA binding protein
MAETISALEAARMLGIRRATVVDLVKKGELRGYKKTIARTSPFVVDRESVLDYDRRRREQTTVPAH